MPQDELKCKQHFLLKERQKSMWATVPLSMTRKSKYLKISVKKAVLVPLRVVSLKRATAGALTVPFRVLGPVPRKSRKISGPRGHL